MTTALREVPVPVAPALPVPVAPDPLPRTLPLSDEQVEALILTAYRTTGIQPMRHSFYLQPTRDLLPAACAVGVAVVASRPEFSNSWVDQASWLATFTDLTGRSVEFIGGVVGGFDTFPSFLDGPPTDCNSEDCDPEYRRGFAVGHRVAEQVLAV